MNMADSIKYIGVKDHITDLFEGQYPIPHGISYNSYLIQDEKIAVMDTVDAHFTDEWLEQIENLCPEKTPDFLVVQHMEPDHSASVCRFMQKYPAALLVTSKKALEILQQFWGTSFEGRFLIVKERDRLTLGSHTLRFIEAPMVHWPEVIMTYEEKTQTLFSADAFGTFGTEDSSSHIPAGWPDEAARYYFGIVGKYGMQVQKVLDKLSSLPVRAIYSLHGPRLTESIDYYLNLYRLWSTYEPDKSGMVIAYTSMYGNTRAAAEKLAELLKKQQHKVILYDLTRDEMTNAVAETFRYDTLILATPTYNGGIFPPMQTFITHLIQRNYQNRRIAFIENGSWAPTAASAMRKLFEHSKNIRFCETVVTIKSALSEESDRQLLALSEELGKAGFCSGSF